jgi:DNA-binding NtrC family response regulator
VRSDRKGGATLNVDAKKAGHRRKWLFYNLIGSNPSFLEAVREARTASKSDSSVLITGERGTGKSVMAQAIHNESFRADGPFTCVGCADIQSDFFSCGLYGYADAPEGGGLASVASDFETENRGTVFLRDVADLTPESQNAFLRALIKSAFTRMDHPHAITFDTRIISATDKDIFKMVDDEQFQMELFHRLNVITIKTVPLRMRKDDIRDLAMSLLKDMALKSGRQFVPLRSDVLERLLAYDWPGNLNELRSVLEKAMSNSSKGIIRAETLVFEPGAWQGGFSPDTQAEEPPCA